MANEELLDRFNAISIPELRRRVDAFVARVREMRNALAAQCGMMFEGVPGAAPNLDPKEAERLLADIIEALPVLRSPLPPEERAKLRAAEPARRAQVKEILDELVDEPEALQEVGVDPEKLAKLREGMIKSDMLEEVEREIAAYHAAVVAYRQWLAESVQRVVEQLERKIGSA